MLKQLELQPKQLMTEKEENGNNPKKHGCVIFAAMSQNSTTIVLGWLKESSDNFYENE